jgi:hypothetical protein
MKTNGHASSNGQMQPPSPPLPPPVAGGDHGTNGRFKVGNKAGQATRFKVGHQAAVGCGNSFARQLGRIRLALATALTDEDVRAIVAALVRLAVEDKSIEAVRFLFDYLVGPPLAHATDPDDLDRAERAKLQLEEAVGLAQFAAQVEAYADGAAEGNP